jgi:hypothetical protein
MRKPATWAIIAFLPLAGCRWSQPTEPPKPFSQRLTWCGRQGGIVLDSVLSDTGDAEACIRIQRLEFPGSPAPLGMELRQYHDPAGAFLAWETLAAGAKPQDGCVRVGSRWAFIHVPFVGLTDSSAGELYAEEFRERLAAGQEPAILFPSQFNAFPLLGRIPGSERIFAKDFLGGRWSGPVYSVSYPCYGDTATAFRAPAGDAASLAEWMRPWKAVVGGGAAADDGFTVFRREMRFDGHDEFGRPMILRAFSDGILGISGCYDSVLGEEYAEKMRKMRVFWHDP